MPTPSGIGSLSGDARGPLRVTGAGTQSADYSGAVLTRDAPLFPVVDDTFYEKSTGRRFVFTRFGWAELRSYLGGDIKLYKERSVEDSDRKVLSALEQIGVAVARSNELLELVLGAL